VWRSEAGIRRLSCLGPAVPATGGWTQGVHATCCKGLYHACKCWRQRTAGLEGPPGHGLAPPPSTLRVLRTSCWGSPLPGAACCVVRRTVSASHERTQTSRSSPARRRGHRKLRNSISSCGLLSCSAVESRFGVGNHRCPLWSPPNEELESENREPPLFLAQPPTCANFATNLAH
jgi:hypothetical protein